MKKSGFTLAEVLITLGIIGVVAALTAPALVQNADTEKIGPTLSKVVSTLENANQQLLNDNEASDISKIAETELEYMETLSQYVQGSSFETSKLDSSSSKEKFYEYDGTVSKVGGYVFHFAEGIDLIYNNVESYVGGEYSSYSKKGTFKGPYCTIWVDINGIGVKPNRSGKDRFLFVQDKAGSVIPSGGQTAAWLQNKNQPAYMGTGNDACNEDKVGTGNGCAGSIFDNNMKVIYQ